MLLLTFSRSSRSPWYNWANTHFNGYLIGFTIGKMPRKKAAFLLSVLEMVDGLNKNADKRLQVIDKGELVFPVRYNFSLWFEWLCPLLPCTSTAPPHTPTGRCCFLAATKPRVLLRGQFVFRWPDLLAPCCEALIKSLTGSLPRCHKQDWSRREGMHLVSRSSFWVLWQTGPCIREQIAHVHLPSILIPSWGYGKLRGALCKTASCSFIENKTLKHMAIKDMTLLSMDLLRRPLE